MLSSAHKRIIQETVPLLETHGQTLTQHFYTLLFTEHPEVQVFFNQTHQSSGQQARALANSILQYARHIDEHETLKPMLERIANKHVALNVAPEHYPTVGNCLLKAIEEVLGSNVATRDVLTAWQAAYAELAELLIFSENNLYQRSAQAPGGWRNLRTFNVAALRQESDSIRSLTLAPADGGPVLDYRAGQYVGLRMMIDGQDVQRTYSLSKRSDNRTLQLSVKRRANGLASSYLHSRRPGDVLHVFPPAGEFVLDEGHQPVVLLTAGVGITPAIPLLEEALARGRLVHFVHATQNSSTFAFAALVRSHAACHREYMSLRLCYSRPLPDDVADATGRLNAQQLREWLPEITTAQAYLVGPIGFMADMKAALLQLGLPETQLRYECFGPHAAL